MTARRGLFAVALGLLICLPGCGDDTGAGNDQDGGGGGVTADGGSVHDGGARDGGTTDGGATDGGTEGRVLTFNSSTPVTVNYSDSADLAFTLKTTSGAIVRNETVTFTLSNNAAGVLAVDRVSTNGSGIATARFTASNQTASVTLTAHADRATDLPVAIEVRPKATGNVNVSVISNARITVGSAQLYVYAPAVGTAPPTCASISGANPPTTSLTGAVAPVPGARVFQNLPTGAGVTVYAVGMNAGGDPIAFGCAEGAIVAGGVTTNISVALTQGPPILAGEYDTLIRVNLGNALPAPYDGYVSLLTQVLSNPAGVASYYALKQADATMGTTFTQWTPPGESSQRQATLDEVLANPTRFPTWGAVSQTLDNTLTNLLGSTYTTVKTIAGDIRTAITQFEVGSHFTLTGTSNASQYTVNESWRALVFNWRTGCATGDTGCARRPFQLANTRYAPVNVSYNAAMSYEPSAGPPALTERYKLALDPHNVPFSYGALVLIALDALVYPSIPGCGTSCHSVNDVLTTLINCGNLGTTIANAVNGAVGVSLITAQQASSFCTNALAAVGQRVEDLALGLTVGGTSTNLGTKGQGVGGGGQLYLVDQDLDLKTELVRDLTMYLQWVNPMNPAQTQDLTAPITGYGRRSASDCSSDAACAANQSCQPIPHYLEVRAVETTCRKNVGATAGRGTCSADADCRSGICVRASGQAMGQCFAACRLAAECGGASCDPSRTSVNLEPVRMGLGTAPASGCGL